MKRVNWDTASYCVGFGLVALCFLFSLVRMVGLSGHGSQESHKKTIRFAHWQLESGFREAIDRVARDYMALHPEIEIQQIPVPERVYNNWFVTQLVGETAPDIIELMWGPTTSERLGKYFVPLTTTMLKPNLYNQGTPSEKIPWRETFYDGLNEPLAYDNSLLEVYGVNLTIITNRLFVNMNLFHRIFGAESKLPGTVTEFNEVCRRVREYSVENKLPLTPLAGSKANGPQILDLMFSSQTQKLLPLLDRELTLSIVKENFILGYLRGEWSLKNPEVLSGVRLMHEVGQNFQPGFLQSERDDSALEFQQGRALMISAGSFDSGTLMKTSRFPIAVVALPTPTRDTPTYGKWVEGPLGDNAGTSCTFGLTRASKHSQEALDFLLYLTSVRGMETFSKTSQWVPSVTNVPLSQELEPFRPFTEGYPEGFLLNRGGGDSARLIDISLPRLYGRPDEGANMEFIDSVSEDFSKALREDLRRELKGRERGIRLSDTTLISLLELESLGKGDEETKRKIAELLAKQSSSEIILLKSEDSLREVGGPKP